MSCALGAPISHSLPGRAHPLHSPGQLCLSFIGPDHRISLDPHGDSAYYLGPSLTHYRCHRVYIVCTHSERITLTLAHSPFPFFHFAESILPPPLPASPTSTSTHPSLTLDDTDLIGRVFNYPDLGLCHVTEVGPRLRLVPGVDDLAPTGP